MSPQGPETVKEKGLPAPNSPDAPQTRQLLRQLLRSLEQTSSHGEAIFRAGRRQELKAAPQPLPSRARTATARSTKWDPPLRITAHEAGSHARAHVGCGARFHGSWDRWRRCTTPSGEPHLAQVLRAAPPQRAFRNHCPIVPGGAGTTVTQMVPESRAQVSAPRSPRLLAPPVFPDAGRAPARGEARGRLHGAGPSGHLLLLARPATPGGSATRNRQQEGFVPGLAETRSQTRGGRGGDRTCQGLGGSWGERVGQSCSTLPRLGDPHGGPKDLRATKRKLAATAHPVGRAQGQGHPASLLSQAPQARGGTSPGHLLRVWVPEPNSTEAVFAQWTSTWGVGCQVSDSRSGPGAGRGGDPP